MGPYDLLCVVTLTRVTHCSGCCDYHFILTLSMLACFNGQTRLVNNYTTSDGIYEYINGTVEVCVDGQYVPICGDNISDIATRSCNGIGYFG